MKDLKLVFRKEFSAKEKKNDITDWLEKNGWSKEEIEDYFEEFGLVMPGLI